jgi:hypothetical protein
MSVPDPEHPFLIKNIQAELDRFEDQAAIVLALALTLSVVSYVILMHALL